MPTVKDIILAEDCERNQRVTITQNGTGYILSYDLLGEGKHYEKWFDNMSDAQGIFFLFCYEFVFQSFPDDVRKTWVE